MKLRMCQRMSYNQFISNGVLFAANVQPMLHVLFFNASDCSLMHVIRDPSTVEGRDVGVNASSRNIHPYVHTIEAH